MKSVPNFYQRIRQLVRARRMRIKSDAPATLGMLEEELARLQAEIAACSRDFRRYSSMHNTELRAAEQWWRRARRAMLRGDEALAREAVKRHVDAQRKAQQCAQRTVQHAAILERYQSFAEVLEAKLSDFEHRMQLLESRRKLTEIRRSLYEILYGEGNSGELEEAEDRVLTEEYATDAYLELAHDSHGITFDAPSEGLRERHDVIAEHLERLRKEVNPDPG